MRSDSNVGIQFDKTALEPRIGLAWKPFGSQTTSVRAGYAIYHDSGWSQGAQGLWQNPPYFAEDRYLPVSTCPFGNCSILPQSSTFNCGLKYGFHSSGRSGNHNSPGPVSPITAPQNPGSFTGGILSQDPNFKQGMVQQFNLNIERQLPGNIVLTAGYAGTRSNPHSVLWLEHERQFSVGLRRGLANHWLHLGCGPGGR